MNKHIYAVGSFALALALGGMPAIALAEENAVGVSAAVTVKADVDAEVKGDVDTDVRTTATVDAQTNVAENTSPQARERAQMFLMLGASEDASAAFSLADLRQRIETRKQELAEEEASTTPRFRNAMRNANEVRLAVHALLVSRGMLGGGIGAQVSAIATAMNDSVATTTNAEARIQSRGFFSRFLFGGDRESADVIANAVARNQERVQALTGLLAEASVSAEVKAELEARIAALLAAQVRLEALAESEQKAWGLFSWRF